MKRKTLKTYLSIPVFLGMLALTGQVAADETVVPASDAADNTSLVTAPTALPETGVTTPVSEKPVASYQPTAVETAGEETASAYSDSTATALTAEGSTASPVVLTHPASNQPGDETTDSETTSSTEQPAVATVTPHASLQVVDYKEDKTDFTVKVTGAEQGKQISKVQVAVWSANKDQDDLKWYTPRIVNNQASFKVNIADHSNASDDYIVHAYTTYADNSTVFTDLGSYKIVKPESKPATVEVVDYQENKTDFTVKVTGAEQGKQISKVQVAVWSAGKDQDDLKWYEPKIINNQASFKVDIANHSNTSDSYIVHAYTTYADKTTAFTNLGAYRIVKPEAKPAKLEVVDYAENKTDFTVKVTGAEQGKQISKVQVAVWSANKDQDDLKWYTPRIVNNQASFKVTIADHSNTSDDYIVHAYTTYTDKTTVFTNLGSYKIVKEEGITDVQFDQLANSGTYTFTARLPIKREPKISSPDRAYYDAGETVNYDSKLKADEHIWISYINYSGSRSYIPISKLTFSQPARSTEPAQLEVVDYAEDKTNFTVKVTGAEQGKQISKVQVAVWSANKDQDDLKWYTPRIVNNQASFKVNIADHSNTSDDYIVHAYTTYADNSTVFTDLGSYKIVKPESKPATVEVVDYQENKTDFTVKVTGAEQGKQISKVQVAVWSAGKDQDDLKWYEPKIINNQASFKVDIANHSNTSDSYIVHAYTTYADKTTAFTNLGAYRIVKPEAKPAKLEVVDYAENKTDFTVKVTGAEQGKQISKVQVAVWSANKDQDDLKWYTPRIVNNQASFKVTIADHSNTSDDYIVHAYTTYTDKTTVFTNLGSYKIVKEEGITDVQFDQLANSGTYTFTARLPIKREPKISSPDRAYYDAGETVNYDSKLKADEHIWISYINYSGSRSYIPISKLTFSQPARSTEPAQLEVVDYAEDKTNFTVKVTGAEQGKQISKVQVAVWSANKDQDDLKWYEPKITNNQASFKVDIANHSNTSDSYIVHAYTTYTDKTTEFTNLGAYRIVKPESKPATVEVVDYEEDKTNFTVRVIGNDQGNKVSKVRVAVWSDGKGQDDLKWYEPKVVDNQSKIKIYISNHSNTSDKYHVHVYTTYADKTTLVDNLGTYQITKSVGERASIEYLEHEPGKKDFVVKVTGAPTGPKVQQVRVAVWSAEKGQDDLKWYEPKVIKNQASVKVNNQNHGGALGAYAIHVYVTYDDKVTQVTDLTGVKLSETSGDYKEKAQQFAGKLFNVIGDYVANDSMLSPLVSAIKHIEDQGYQVGFKLSDVRTNKGIEYNANKRFYSASTIKAPFVVSLAEQYPEKIAEHRPVLEAIAKQSSNSGYAQLQERYGHGVIHHWADQSGINRDHISRRYPDLTPEELHALWESNYEYIQEGAHGKQIGAMFETPNFSPIKSVLGQSYKTQSKAGWIGDWEYRAANDAGIVYTPKGDYIVSIMSNSYGNLGLLNPLVKALNQLHQKL